MRGVLVETAGPAESLRVQDIPEPSPGAGEISIKVSYAGVGFVDTLFRAGAFDLPMPLIPGIEVTGHVLKVGDGVDRFTVGQPVAATLNDFGRGMRAGGYAEVAVAHSSMAVPVPDDADLAKITAGLVNGATAWIALHDLARLGVSDDVLVLGASGGLGSITGRLAALHPARRVFGVTGSPHKNLFGSSAWTEIIRGSELESVLDDLTDGRGVDIVIDPVGDELRSQAFERLAPFGRHVVLGDASGNDRSFSADSAWLNTRQVIGFNMGGTAHLIPDRVQNALSAVVGLIHRGVLQEVEPAVLPLEQAAQVHQTLENRTAPAKTVLSIV
ncbi:MAG: zinc-binding dehydrogenase [Corynebacteriales bacterium]|nr:zinc-binding dehydrogenase [Mycobacteriales bacterium]